MKFNLDEKRSEILETVALLLPNIDTASLETKFDAFSKNIGGKASDEQIYEKFIFDLLYDSGKLYIIDWKWALEDILSSLSETSGTISYEVIEENQDDETGEVNGTIKINGKEYSFDGLYREGFTEEINDALDDQGIENRLLIVDQDRGDNFEFVVVSKEAFDSLTGSDFLPFGTSW